MIEILIVLCTTIGFMLGIAAYKYADRYEKQNIKYIFKYKDKVFVIDTFNLNYNIMGKIEFGMNYDFNKSYKILLKEEKTWKNNLSKEQKN